MFLVAHVEKFVENNPDLQGLGGSVERAESCAAFHGDGEKISSRVAEEIFQDEKTAEKFLQDLSSDEDPLRISAEAVQVDGIVVEN